MFDLNPEDLFDAIDRLLAGLLERAGFEEPPVDVLALAAEHLGIPITYTEPETDESGRRRPGARRAEAGITLTEDMTDEQQHTAAANGIARALMPEVMRKIGLPPGSETRQMATHLRSLVVPRLLVPSRMLREVMRTTGHDLFALKEHFLTATMETIAQRWLDRDDPCAITIADDGVVALRKANRFPVTRKLEAVEQECLDRVLAADEPARLRSDIWTVQGWPIPDRPFRRVLLRSVPDDV